MRISQIALIAAALVAVSSVGARAWRDRAAAAQEEQARGSPEDALIADLQARTRAVPRDPEAWRALGEALFQSGKATDSAAAYRQAVALAPGNAQSWSALGQATMFDSDPRVENAARSAFVKALAIDPKEPRARYFLAVAKDMGGDHKGAVDDLFALLADTQPGAPWEAMVRQTVTAIGTNNRIDVKLRLGRLRQPGQNAVPLPTADAKRTR